MQMPTTPEGPKRPRPPRNKHAYNKALKMAVEAWHARAAADPNFNEPWHEFRPKYIKQVIGTIPEKPRGPKASENPTARQKYHQVYQKAYNNAKRMFEGSPELMDEFDEFKAYWAKHKTSFLPAGFLKNRAGMVSRSTKAKDARTAYQIVYHQARKRWECNVSECNQRFNYSWEDYWTQHKAQAFLTGDHEHEAPIPDLVANEDLSGGPAPTYSRVPKGWLGRKLPRGAKPFVDEHGQSFYVDKDGNLESIKPFIPAVEVRLDTDPPVDAQGWITFTDKE